jgi:Rho GTPase-activating protein RGD1
MCLDSSHSYFPSDSSKVDFTDPERFFHDVNSVAGLLKQFLRDLPDPLLTRQYYTEFITTARKYSSGFPCVGSSI